MQRLGSDIDATQQNHFRNRKRRLSLNYFKAAHAVRADDSRARDAEPAPSPPARTEPALPNAREPLPARGTNS